MQDADIIALYFARSEQAIAETNAKYGAYLNCVAYNVLRNHSDTEEIVEDTYMAAWSTMPPEWPDKLKHFLSRITRNLSFKRLEYNSAAKRASGTQVLLEELEECLPGSHSLEDDMDARQISELLNLFLSELPKSDVQLFVSRYYYAMTLQEISRKYAIPIRKVQYRLSMMRSGLRALLEKEGIVL